MDIREIHTSEIEEARLLLSEHGWGHRVANPDLFSLLVSKSQRAVVAVDGSKVIGFARAICDDLSNGYLSMVVVDSAHRRQGVGRALVRAVMGDNQRMTWVLRAGRAEEQPFFERLGFVPSRVAMERIRANSPDT